MATNPAVRAVLSKDVQDRLMNHVRDILRVHKSKDEMRDKMRSIDTAYARYTAARESGDGSGVDYGNTPCDIFGADNIVAPIVVSQVDSSVAYLAEVFLSGYPLFPVVSTPMNRKWAEQLETLIDDHSILGGYARQLLIFLRDAVKYNFSALEADWDQIDQFSVVGDLDSKNLRKVNRENKSFTKLKRLDPYNVVYDDTVSPGDISKEGDYAGYIELISRTKLTRLLNKLQAAGEEYNKELAIKDGNVQVNGATGQADYTEHPKVSDYISKIKPQSEVDWYKYFEDNRVIRGPGNFEIFTVYVRIVPADYMMNVPQPKVPQIWKLRVINANVIISAKRIISAQDTLPILFGQPLEDGMRYQTKSIAESEIPFQEAATKLINIRFSAARRAVSDRALYDPEMIKPGDINAAVPAPKIPVRGNAMKGQNRLDMAYKQIPFDMRGTETTLQDAATLVEFSKQLSGINNPRQGQFQKGNKSVQEWNDTMSGSDGRQRLHALALEFQVFVPLKETLKLNIFQYGDNAVVVSQKNGDVHTIDLAELRKQTLAFRIADGYSPKSKLASVEMLTTGLTMISQMPGLQQAYGAMLPALFAHMMQLGGVRGLEEYAPTQSPMASPMGLPANSLAGVDPSGQAAAAVPVEGMPMNGMMPQGIV